MKAIRLYAPIQKIQTEIQLPSSKSESNRALVLRALTQLQGGEEFEIKNLSEARDTQTLIKLLQSKEKTLDVLDAGTTMRFLTALVACSGVHKILTGTTRMCERPIGILADALNQLGADIRYLHKQGFPPLEINTNSSTFPKNQITDFLQIRGDVSSQYISALLMIAPLLPRGLNLQLEGKIASRPYIEMTLEQMQLLGIRYEWEEEKQMIRIPSQNYQSRAIHIESDWSGASYWYAMVALSKGGEVFLAGLKKHSLQGDSVIAHIMEALGVESHFTNGGVHLKKIPGFQTSQVLNYDFSHCPDLAQTLISLCAAQKLKIDFNGLESLRIKETDRIAALQKELAKTGALLQESKKGGWELNYDSPVQNRFVFQTYEDHRMAMSLAPWALVLNEIEIENPEVTAKSYPGFWDDLRKAGFGISEVN